MSRIPASVKDFINETKSVVFSTADGAPNSSVIFFKTVNEQDQIVLFDVFMKKNLLNLAKNPEVSIVVFNDATLRGYQLKGKAVYTTDAALVAAGNNVTSGFKLTTKGVVVVDVETVYNLSPGPNVGAIVE